MGILSSNSNMDFLRTNRSITCLNGNICESGGGTAPGFSSKSGGGGGIRTTPVSNTQPASYMRKKNFSQENAACISQLSVETLTPIFNYLEFGIAQDGLTLELGNALTYPQDRVNVVAEALEKMCQDPDTFTSIVPFLIEDQIDDTQLHTCSKGVLDEIKGLQNIDVAKILAKLGAEDAIYKMTLKTGFNYTTINGSTTQITSPANAVRNFPLDYTIYINPDYEGKTQLFIAALLIHEMIHVYFFSLFDDHSFVNNASFPLSSANSHHEEMANTYVNIIASALQEFQTGVEVPNGFQPHQTYIDLAWNGLLQTQIFNVAFPIGSAERARITNKCISEQIGQDYQGQSVIGNPCN